MIPSLSLAVLLAATVFNIVSADGGHGGHSHVVIHVPYKIKTIHHTHTITKHVHHGGGGGDKYEVLGYTVGHPVDLGGHGGGGGHGLHGGGNDIGGWSGHSGFGSSGGGGDFGGGFGGHEGH
ncbi:glycine-rich cell wall structural protein [Orussus abietinus]|uniref:glycine-rich cell wall structural protein n=1 Tax=Orussus abietinus TaxID=222816 RepID=UPI000625D13F|nr:glycine-rich cell wall structural protein [Orussus abietinus]